MGGESLYVRLVNDEMLERDLRRHVAVPREAVVDHDRLRGDVRVVAGVERQIASGVRRVVREQEVLRVARLAAHGLGVRIEQELVLVEPMSARGIERTPHAIAVALTR